MGFENCEVGFGIKLSWEMGLVLIPPIPQDPLFRKRVHRQSSKSSFFGTKRKKL